MKITTYDNDNGRSGPTLEDDAGRTFDIDVMTDGTLELTGYGLTEDSNHPFSECQFAPEVTLKFTTEQAPDVVLALQTWIESLDKKEMAS